MTLLIGENIKRLRRERNLTQEEMGTRRWIPRHNNVTYVSKLLWGKC